MANQLAIQQLTGFLGRNDLVKSTGKPGPFSLIPNDQTFHHLLENISWGDTFVTSPNQGEKTLADFYQKITQTLLQDLCQNPKHKLSLIDYCATKFCHHLTNNTLIDDAASWILLFLVSFGKISYRRVVTKETERTEYNPQKLVSKRDYLVWLNH